MSALGTRPCPKGCLPKPSAMPLSACSLESPRLQNALIGVDSTPIFLVAAVAGDVSSCRKIAGLDLMTSCESVL